MDEKTRPLTFLEALEKGDLATVKQYVEYGKSVNALCSNGLLPLFIIINRIVAYNTEISSIKNYIDILEYLLEEKADPNISIPAPYPLEKTTTLLHLLISTATNSEFGFFSQNKNSAELSILNTAIGKLIVSGANLEAPDAYGSTPLHSAIRNNNLNVAERLITAGACLKTTDLHGTPLLHLVSAAGMTTLVQYLLRIPDIDIAQKNSQGKTALDAAYSSNKLDICLILLEKNCPYTVFDLIDLFNRANIQNHQTLINYLLNQGVAKKSKIDGTTALHHATNYETAVNLLKYGANVHARNDKGETPLLLLANYYYGIDNNIFELLLNHGAEITAADNEGNTILHIIFVFNKSLPLVKFLEKHTLINVKNALGKTPLHNAIENCAPATAINELLLNNADPNLKDNNNDTALDCIPENLFYMNEASNYIKPLLTLLKAYPATQLPKNYNKLIKYAIRNNCYEILEELSVREADFSRSLINAVINKNIEMITWLIKHGANLNYRDNKVALLPIQLAVTLSNEIAILLIEHHANTDVKDPNGNNLLDLFFRNISYQIQNQEEFNTAKKLLDLLLSKNIPINPSTYQLLFGPYGNNLLTNHFTNHFALILYMRKYIFLDDMTHGIKILLHCLKHKIDYKTTLQQLREQFQDISPIYSEAAQFAVDTNNIKLLDELLIEGLNINQTTRSSLRLIEYAFEKAKQTNDTEMIRYFISKGVSLHFPATYRANFLANAIENDWHDIIELLLSPTCGFKANMYFPPHGSSIQLSSALQVAVQHQSIAAVTLLLKHNADINIISENGFTLLHTACANGDITIARLLLEAGITIKKSVDLALELFSTNFSPMDLAIQSNINDEIKHQFIELLLAHQHPVDTTTVQIAIIKLLEEKSIELLLSKLTIEIIVQNRLLHIAVTHKHLQTVNILIKKYADLLIHSKNQRGQIPLHLAAISLNKNIYEMLLAAGSDTQTVDYLGYNAEQYLFLFNNDYSQMPELGKLIANIADEPEFQNHYQALFNRAHYSYLLIRLFNTADIALEYISKYRSKVSSQPLHDLCQYNLPATNNWNTHAWAMLALQHGTEITKYLYLAPRIEQLCTTSPLSLEAIQATAATIKYNREEENPSLAALFRKHNVCERGFERVLNEYHAKEADDIPDISIDGEPLGEPRYYLKKLTSIEGFVLGDMTRCCQIIGSAGESCAWHGMTSRYGGFYVIYMRANLSDVQKAKTLLDKAENAASFEGFITDMPKGQKEKYKKQYGTDIILLRKELTAKYTELNKHKIIAQTWAWISTNTKDLCLDSWERLYPQDDRLCSIFFNKLAEILINKHGFETIYLGLGGNTPKNLSYTAAETLIQPKDYMDYRDSHRQVIIASRSNLTPQTKTYSQLPTLFKHPATVTTKTYSAIEFKQILNSYLIHCTNVQLLEHITKEQLREYDFNFIELPTINELNTCYLLPIQEDENWACIIIKPSNLTYLNMQVNNKNSSLLNWLRKKYNGNYVIAKFQINYESDFFFSSVRLLSILKQYLKTGSLNIDSLISLPIEDLIAEQAILLKTDAVTLPKLN